jgi:hypothetical protein
MLDWLEATAVARSVAASATVTAWLSAVHAVGFALVTGSALVANLRGVGAVLRQCPLADVVRPANRAIALGLAVSAATGLLLFAARAADVGANGPFRVKMLLLIAAAGVQLTLVRAAAARGATRSARAAGAAALALWLGLVLAAFAFVLFE